MNICLLCQNKSKSTSSFCDRHTIEMGENKAIQQKQSLLPHYLANHAEPSGIPPIVHEVLNFPGQPLDPDTRTSMESHFGYDFSKVRVHTDSKAAKSAQAVNALAYTVEQDIVFDVGQYAPSKEVGLRLLAHELAHVVQQSRSKNSVPPSLSSSTLEYEAEQAASALTHGNRSIRISQSSTPRLACRLSYLPRSLSRSLNLGSSDEELYQEINLIHQWLYNNPGSNPEHDRLLTQLYALENEVWQRQQLKGSKPEVRHQKRKTSIPSKSKPINETANAAVENSKKEKLIQEGPPPPAKQPAQERPLKLFLSDQEMRIPVQESIPTYEKPGEPSDPIKKLLKEGTELPEWVQDLIVAAMKKGGKELLKKTISEVQNRIGMSDTQKDALEDLLERYQSGKVPGEKIITISIPLPW